MYFHFFKKTSQSYLSRLPPSRDGCWWWDVFFEDLSPEELKLELDAWVDEFRYSAPLEVGIVVPPPVVEKNESSSAPDPELAMVIESF